MVMMIYIVIVVWRHSVDKQKLKGYSRHRLADVGMPIVVRIRGVS